MKIFLCTFLFASFVLAPSLRAQDAPSRLGKGPPTDIPIEPTPLPRINATPAPTPPPPEPVSTPVATPMVEVSSSATPTATATPEEKVMTKSRPRRARAKRVSTSEATPPAHAEAPPTPPPATSAPVREHSWWEGRGAASELKALEKQWEAAFNDPAVIEKCVADDFVGTSPAGEIMSKKDLLRAGEGKPGHAATDDRTRSRCAFPRSGPCRCDRCGRSTQPQPRRPGGPVSIPFYRHLGKARRHMEMRGEPINARAAIS